jgi:hypothetical protein
MADESIEQLMGEVAFYACQEAHARAKTKRATDAVRFSSRHR